MIMATLEDVIEKLGRHASDFPTVNSINEYKSSLLYDAFKRNNRWAVESLLSLGADLNLKLGTFGRVDCVYAIEATRDVDLVFYGLSCGPCADSLRYLLNVWIRCLNGYEVVKRLLDMHVKIIGSLTYACSWVKLLIDRRNAVRRCIVALFAARKRSPLLRMIGKDGVSLVGMAVWAERDF